jgi:hypothetical protein
MVSASGVPHCCQIVPETLAPAGAAVVVLVVVVLPVVDVFDVAFGAVPF